jgi:hypothetical protein
LQPPLKKSSGAKLKDSRSPLKKNQYWLWMTQGGVGKKKKIRPSRKKRKEVKK